MDLKDVAITFVVIVGFATGLLNFSGQLFNRYDTDIVNSTQYRSFEDVVDETSDQQEDYRDQTINETGSNEIVSDIDENFAFLPTIWRGVQDIWTAQRAMTKGMLQLASNSRFVPSYAVSMLVGVLTMIVVWGILKFK